MPIVRETATGESFLQKTKTGADSQVKSQVQLYEKVLGSSGATSNTVFTLAGVYVPTSNTLMVFVNGQKTELNAAGTTPSEYAETDYQTVTFKASLLDSDVVEFMVFGNYIYNLIDLQEQIDIYRLSPSVLSRSNFTYNGGSAAYTIKVGGGIYRVKDKTAKWITELTTNAIGTPIADTWYYLYLDYSAITSLTNITASELIWSSIEPTYSHEHKGWYNGDDLCIFSVLTNSGPTNILEFFHSGDQVFYADVITEVASWDVDNVWLDRILTGPSFTNKIYVILRSRSATNAIAYWRTKGQTGPTGHISGQPESGGGGVWLTVPVITDNNQTIQLKYNLSDASTIDVYTDGWCFPEGM